MLYLKFQAYIPHRQNKKTLSVIGERLGKQIKIKSYFCFLFNRNKTKPDNIGCRFGLRFDLVS